MSLPSNTIRYSTIVTIKRAEELVKTCQHADRCLADVLKHLSDDSFLTEQQRSVVTKHAIDTREVLHKSIEVFTKVVKIWDLHCHKSNPSTKEK